MKRRLFHTALVALLLLLPTTAMGYDIEFEGIYYDIIASNELPRLLMRAPLRVALS